MPEVVAIELDSPQGEALQVEWDLDELAGRAGDRAAFEWTLSGELDWDEIEALRVVSAALPDGRGLALVALRPAGAGGHGDEAVAATLVAGGAAEPVAEPLLSVESGGDGLPRRVGLELHAGTDALPLRVAADVTDSSRAREGGVERIRAALEVRLDGKRSAGAYDVLSAAGPAIR